VLSNFFSKGIDIWSLLIKNRFKLRASSAWFIPIFCFSMMPFKYVWICSIEWFGWKYRLIRNNSGREKLFSYIWERESLHSKLILFFDKDVDIVYNWLFWLS
jgi:hypothetical protein